MKKITTKDPSLAISRSLSTERYLKDIKDLPQLPPSEEKQIVTAAIAGDVKARQRVIEAYLKFVVSCAQRYQTPGIDIMDLIAAGNEGISLALKSFDVEKGIKFISYAVWYIKNAIISEIIEQKNMIYLPLNQQEYINQFKQEKQRLDKEFEGGVSETRVMENLEEKGYTSQHRNFAVNASTGVGSLDEPVSTDEDSHSLSESIKSGSYEGFLNSVDFDHKKVVIKNALDKLPRREREVLTMSFGFGVEPMCNEDIARKLNVSVMKVTKLYKDGVKLIQDKKYLKDLV